MGRPLVRNRTALVVTVDRSVLRPARRPTRDAVRRRLAKAAARPPPAALTDKITLCGTPDAPTASRRLLERLAVPADPGRQGRHASRWRCRSWSAREDYPGVTAELEAVREYPQPYGANAAHELGYLGPVTDRTSSTRTAGRRRNPLLPQRPGRPHRPGGASTTPSCAASTASSSSPSTTPATSPAPSARPGPGPATTWSPTSTRRCRPSLEKQLAAAVAARAARQTDQQTGKHYKADSAAGVVMDVTQRPRASRWRAADVRPVDLGRRHHHQGVRRR